MRWSIITLLALCTASSWAGQPGDAIAAVLDRSQARQLAALSPAAADALPSRKLQADFDRLAGMLDLPPGTRLRVVQGEFVGETLQGQVVVNESVADMPEGDRLFVLAHEIGHITLGHWAEMADLYRRWVPGEVVQSQTDRIAPQLGREASALAHTQEFEADAFALRTMRLLGRPDEEVLATFVHFDIRSDTATHPGTRRRMAALEALMRADAVVAQGPAGGL